LSLITLLALLLVMSALQCTMSGLVGSGRIALLLFPMLALILVGSRAGWVAVGISVIVFGVFTALADPFSEFSDQQLRVYELLGEGLSTDEIAELLHVSPRTVESYGARMIEKLNVSGMKDLRRRAIADRLHRHLNPH
jgi:DNA-binding NarL/FixJ family response regulator